MNLFFVVFLAQIVTIDGSVWTPPAVCQGNVEVDMAATDFICIQAAMYQESYKGCSENLNTLWKEKYQCQLDAIKAYKLEKKLRKACGAKCKSIR